MNSKNRKLYRILDDLGYWREGFPFRDMYRPGEEPTDEHRENVMNRYLNQLEERLSMFEWLLQRLERDILKNYNEIQESKDYEVKDSYRIKRIRDILFTKGLLFTNKFTKNMDFQKVVEGITGTDSSFQLVYELAKYVQAFKGFNSKNFYNDLSLVTQLADYKDELINHKMTLFPLDFPRMYNFTSAEIPKKVAQMQEELQEETLALEEQFLKLQAAGREFKREIDFATDEEKLKYGYILTDFTQTLKKFVEDYRIKKVKMKNIIWKFESNKIDLPENYSEFFNDFAGRQNHIDFINRLLEKIDLDSKITDLENELKLIPQ